MARHTDATRRYVLPDTDGLANMVGAAADLDTLAKQAAEGTANGEGFVALARAVEDWEADAAE